MLAPDPKVVRQLLTRYATLRIAQAERHTAAVAEELEDVTRRLCVTMGTAGIHDAVARADDLLTRARTDLRRSPEEDGESGLSLAV
ncbi:DUF5133 domain-containing protein [Streptomyces cellulosae]|uniref:Uncharacterized protein with GYD domain n=1 Tax=Streptomyces thermodiastaticus TaxID=44061 RepID=A0ABU0KNX7_9ACTN|nr:uncharacterized protein with GYD domain [Streptomyces thermodiastaticus]MYQ34027.1 DUF5133 domain-containing protein [Streptomyces sp. SID4956]THC58819.1 DUF5133 domain-containing protein [Streptomyces sp. Akac8]UVT13298.1 DUF5133 domain-containing protein [Streptomyces thermocarboxydus]WSB45137.1 DUF5133 domain-containing protein [Streptomyces cellulosae]